MMRTKTIQIRAIEFDSAGQAIQYADACGRGEAILLGGRYLLVEPAEAERIAAMGIEFAYVIDHELPDGTSRIMTVPVNDDD